MPQTDDGKVKLLKASAGAGKTHFLTREYIRMIMEGAPECYRHILAVTFTNKATEEMKSRVIRELHRISTDMDNPDHEKARDRLTRILHDYSHLSISTIDRFFQTVIRSFARELGQYATYRVELDTSSVVDSTIDLLLDSLDCERNRDLFDWLDDYSSHRVENGDSWDFVKPLKLMAKEFFTENFKVKLRESGAVMGDRSEMRRMGVFLDQTVTSFESQLRDIGLSVLKVMAEASLSESDFKGKSRGPFNVFRKWAGGRYDVPKESLRDSYNGHRTVELENLVETALSLFYGAGDVRYRNYRTAKLIRGSYHLLGIYSDIYRTLQEYLKENNLILLGESNDLLSRIIDGNDTPFVYEKTGTRYDHIMLDEAQDTSVLQWRNFKPLFQETLSNGNSNLVVGDIKQSIYRWRGSDWHLMSDYIYSDLGADNISDDGTLNENWRSLVNIIDFNNMVYDRIGGVVKARNLRIGEEIERIYGDSRQTVPASRRDLDEQGYVGVDFIDESETLERIFEEIGELVASGYRYSDISILTRTNRQGSEIADFLIDNGIGVITDESLLLGSSPCICRLTDLLQYVVNPQDQVNRMMVSGIGNLPDNLAEGSLYGICEGLLSGGAIEAASGDVPFIHAFMDCVLDYQDKYGSSVRGFLKWWEESGCKKSIKVPEGQNAVRILTIHKSKGLSLEAVIIPYFDYPFSTGGTAQPTIWCRPDGDFSDLGLVPVKASENALSCTCFERDCALEKTYGYIDVVNLAYVATTRAKSSLKIFAPLYEDPEDDIGSVFFSILEDSLGPDGNFELGQRGMHPDSSLSDESPEPLIQKRYSIVPVGDRLRVKSDAADYFSQVVSPRLRGIELHRVLELCQSPGDLEAALDRAVSDGTLREEDRGETSAILSAAFGSVAGLRWFDGTYSSLNEVSIVDSDGGVHRPDRVLVDDAAGAAIVIDYKFGADRPVYADQVRSYCALLRGMGYSEVSGYIWFPERMEVTMIDPAGSR